MLGMFAVPAAAQLAPAQLYNGVNRPLRVGVRAPEGTAAGSLVVQLIDPANNAVTETAAVNPGEIDLAAAFPKLWTSERPRVLLAQLASRVPAPADAAPVPGEVRDDSKPITPRPDVISRIGPPVVLQPMLSAPRADLDDKDPKSPKIIYPKARQPEVNAYTGIRAYVDQHVVLITDAGEIRIKLRPDAAPNTAWNFRHLAEGGFYTDVEFHRVVPVGRIAGKGFVIQGGDPTGTGEGTPGYEIGYEASTLPHDFGVVSMARDAHPNTNGCQMFICLSREETARLDGLYTAFGQIVEGPSTQTVRTIAAGKLLPGKQDRPENPVRIKRAMLVDAPPVGQGPVAVKLAEPGGR